MERTTKAHAMAFEDSRVFATPLLSGYLGPVECCQAMFDGLSTCRSISSCVWPAAHSFFTRAAASPAAVINGSLRMELGIELAPPPATPSQGKCSARNQIDMARIRLAATGDSFVEKLLSAAFDAMAKATANHAAEWLPAGLESTDGSTTTEGRQCAGCITPELRAKYS